MNQSFGFIRNNYGVVTSKTIDAMMLYKSKKDNKCYAGWRSYQYEALDGGTFDTQIKQWFKRDSAGQLDFVKLPEELQMETGSWYEVDCAAFPPAPTR